MSSIISRNFNSFGKALEWLLAERQMEQVEFSELTGIDPGTISKYVNDKANPPKPPRIKWFGELLGGKIEEQPDGSWTASITQKAKNAINAVEEAKDASSLYTEKVPEEGEIVQSLELAERLIRRTLLILRRDLDR